MVMQRDEINTILRGAAMLAVVVWLCLPATAAQAADSPELIVKVDRTKLYEGDSLVYQVTVNHVDNPREPDLKPLDADFTVARLPQQSLNSSSVVIINGRMTKTERRGQQYNYRLTPRRTGAISIPAPSVEIDGRTIRGQEVTITVIAPEEQNVVRMKIQADRETVYPMQPFTVTLSIDVRAMPGAYSGRNPLSLREAPSLQIPWAIDEQLPKGLTPKVAWKRWLGSMENPEGAGFSINDIGRDAVFSMFGERRIGFMPPAEKVQLPDKSGKKVDYWRYEFRRTFIPKQIGPVTFGPAILKGAFATELNEAGQLEGESVYAVAKPLLIDVQDVPREGRPACYIGAVGTFRLSAELMPKKVKTGDPMTLTLTLEGEGTLDSASPPDLGKTPAIAEHFKIYEATEQTKGDRREFTYSLRPLDTEIKEFPSVPAAYFDVDAKKYVTLQTDPIPIEVSKAVRLASRDIVASARGISGNSKEIETRHEGIFANITDPAQLGDETIRPERWLGGIGGLALAYGVLLLGVGRWRRIRGDTALVRRRAAVGVARRKLRQAKADFAARRTNEAADGVLAALLGLVGDTLDLPGAGLTSAEACRQLESLGVEAELIARLRSILEHCEGVHYGASAGGSQSLVADAERLIHPLESAMKKKRPRLPLGVGVVLLSAALFGGCGRAVDVECAQKFQAAQQAFDEARKPEEFAKAAALDQEILDCWGPSGAVLYNQGNAWMQAGQPGRAVAAYRQAQRYLPRDPCLEANLSSSLGPDAPASSRPILETILFWQNWLSYPEKFYWAGSAALATFVVALASLFFRRRWLGRVAWAALTLTCVLAFSAAYDWQRFADTQHGVVIQPQTVARKGNAVSYEPAFKTPLGEATEFRVIERRGDWLLIRLPGGGEGWIEERAAETY